MKIICPKCYMQSEHSVPWYFKSAAILSVALLFVVAKTPVADWFDREVWNPPNSYVAQQLLDSINNDQWDIARVAGNHHVGSYEYRLVRKNNRIVLGRRGLDIQRGEETDLQNT